MAYGANTPVPAAAPASIRGTLQRFEAGCLAAAMSFAIAMSTIYYEEFTTSRLFLVLVALLVLQVLRDPRLVFARESKFYALFVAWLCVTMLWTPDPVLGLNTLFPATDFLLIAVMLGTLFDTDDPRAVVMGALGGLLAAAAEFSLVTHFPVAIPLDFSYNAFASMYFYGLFLTMVLGWRMHSRAPVLMLALLFVLLIAATTSIKMNLGMLLGVFACAFFYRRQTLAVLRRNAVFLVLGAFALGYVILSNEKVLDRLEYGLARVTVGIEVLQAREDRAGYTGFGERQLWMKEGLRAWAKNPVFGHGVEAFRVPFGITSHSTPVDLLYNSGLIGFCLFYAVLASLGLRCWKSRADKGLRAIVLLGLVTFAFGSLSSTLFYQSFLGAFVGISATLLRDRRLGDVQSISSSTGNPAQP